MRQHLINFPIIFLELIFMISSYSPTTKEPENTDLNIPDSLLYLTNLVLPTRMFYIQIKRKENFYEKQNCYAYLFSHSDIIFE
jgi:hypothetical protein